MIQKTARFNGTGGLNKSDVGYQINRNLSVGADANYNFGK
jgi:hypothetical protein